MFNNQESDKEKLKEDEYVEDITLYDNEILEYEEEKREINIFKELFGMLIYIIIVLLLTFFIVTFVGQRTQVSGRSMESTLEDGDNLIVDKISYRFVAPKRFDIIVFPYQFSENVYYIKRIIGLPGETVQIIDSEIYINGEVLEENYGKETLISAGIAEEPIVLGEKEYFVMGDNRNHSSDSRDSDVGKIDKDTIVGRAFLRIWPFNHFGILKHQ